MKKKILTSMILATGIAFSAQSMAVLNIYSNEALLAEKASKDGQYIFNQEGLSPETTRVVQANVNNMPLEMALKTLTNNEWKIIINEEAKNTLVSFKGGQSWPYILERLTIDNNLKTNIDWRYRILAVFSSEAREKAIADRREGLIKKEISSIENSEKQLNEAKKDYKKFLEEKYNSKKISQQGKSSDLKASKSQKNDKSMVDELLNNQSEHLGKNKNLNDSDSLSHDYSVWDDESNEGNNNMLNEYLLYKRNNSGYPFKHLTDDAPYSYTIQKGDTLWDISDTFLQNPWFWPEIWYINPSVENPHLIYPGDNLLIDPSKEDK
jgi:nucleoid-associated protein YgaU